MEPKMNMQFRTTLASVLRKLSVPVFLAGFDKTRSKLTLHVRSGFDTRAVKLEAEKAITLAGVLVEVDVRGHRLAKLTHPRSLEHWVKRFGTGEILHDPTHIASRARGLVEAARSCRSMLGNLAGGNFFDSDRRTLVVCARMKGDAQEAISLRMRIGAIVEDTWNRTLAYLDRSEARASPLNVQIVSEIPARKLVAVDARSASLLSKLGLKFRHWIAAAAMGVAALAGASVAEARLPPDMQSPRSAAATQKSSSEWGVLTGLTVFVDGARQYETDSFAANGLRMYFGEEVNGEVKGILVAKNCYTPSGKKIAGCTPPMYLGS
jgi:hypothetical protein